MFRFVPETKDLSLEQLDEVFNLSTPRHMAHGFHQLSFWVQRYLFLRKYVKKPTLVHANEQDYSEEGSIADRSESRDSEGGHEMQEVRAFP